MAGSDAGVDLEVAHDPEPDITINWQPNGDYTAQIQYTNADTGETMPALVVEVTE